MREATEQEYGRVLAAIGWPAPRIICCKRTVDVFHTDRGTEAATKTTIFKRGKILEVIYSVNPSYLD